MTQPLPPQQQPIYYAPPVAPPTNGAATGALVLGIIGIVIGIWTPIPFLGLFTAMLAFVPALLAAVFGHAGLKRSRFIGGIGRQGALTGMILGYVTLGIMVLTTIGWMISWIYALSIDR